MKKILVVDDSRLARQALREIVESAGYRVEEASSGAEALEKYPVDRPDLVLLDLLMEGTGGLETLRELLTIDPKAKVVIVSAVVQIATQLEARTAGAVGYVTKPFNREELLERVSRILAGRRIFGLSEWHQSSLAELINLGYGRAAGALSDMVGQRVLLDAPRVGVVLLAEVGSVLGGGLEGEVAGVHQVFSGPVSGDAVLVLGKEAAPVLRGLLHGEESRGETWDEPAREALVEVGNVLLNACLGVLSNVAKVPLNFAVPQVRVGTIEHMLSDITLQDRDRTCAVVIQTRLRLQEANVEGYLLVILGMASYDRLLGGLEESKQWEERQPLER